MFAARTANPKWFGRQLALLSANTASWPPVAGSGRTSGSCRQTSAQQIPPGHRLVLPDAHTPSAAAVAQRHFGQLIDKALAQLSILHHGAQLLVEKLAARPAPFAGWRRESKTDKPGSNSTALSTGCRKSSGASIQGFRQWRPSPGRDTGMGYWENTQPAAGTTARAYKGITGAKHPRPDHPHPRHDPATAPARRCWCLQAGEPHPDSGPKRFATGGAVLRLASFARPPDGPATSPFSIHLLPFNEVT